MNKKALAAATLALALTALLYLQLQPLQLTGLFGLPEEQEIQKEARIQEKESEINAGLSFEVLKPTRLEASLFLKEPLPECPKQTEAEITIKNTGTSNAEKMYLEFRPGVKVISCSNCTLDEIRPGQEVKTKARLCLESTNLQALTIGSANSNSVELQLEK